MNRMTVRNFATLEKGPVNVFVKFSVGATGAPTLDAANSKGIKTITRTGVGAYTVAFGGAAGVDTYQRLMGLGFNSIAASTSASGVQIVADNSANKTAPGVNIVFTSAPGVAVEVGNGEVILLDIILSNSTAM
jgi:hypothetical protein